jgi:hypothetical protein
MHRPRVTAVVGALAAAVAASLCGCGQRASTAPVPVSVSPPPAAADEKRGDTWESIAKQPDFTTGVWLTPLDIGTPMTAQNEPPSLTPEYQKKLEAAKTSPTGGYYSADACSPRGVPSIMWVPYPKKFMFEPKGAFIFFEAFMQTRFIHMDGRGHPPKDDLLPTFNGHSIAHWEGDTWVIDTVGFVDNTPIVNINTNLVPLYAAHSDQMHVIERIRLTAKDEMEIETTVEDPVALTKPWVRTVRLQRLRQDPEEFYCTNPLDLNSIK